MRLSAGVILLLVVGVAGAQDCRFYHASQHNWEGRKGFYLDVEGCELKTLRFILGVADGTDWRFLAVVPPFEGGRRYVGRAEITPETARLFLNGELRAEEAGGFMPATGAFEANITYPWSANVGDY